MRSHAFAALLLLVSYVSASADDKVLFLSRDWKAVLPDDKFSIAKSDGEGGVILADRGYLITDWKTGGVLDFDIFYLEKPYLVEPGQQQSYAPHLSVGLRTKGEYQKERSFELKGDRALRLRLGGGQALYEKPAVNKNEDAERLADKRFPALVPYKWHHIEIDDSGKVVRLSVNGNLVFEEAIDVPGDGNKLMISVRENNAGQNLVLVRAPRVSPAIEWLLKDRKKKE